MIIRAICILIANIIIFFLLLTSINEILKNVTTFIFLTITDIMQESKINSINFSIAVLKIKLSTFETIISFYS